MVIVHIVMTVKKKIMQTKQEGPLRKASDR